MKLETIIPAMEGLTDADLSRLIAATNAEKRRRDLAAHVATHQDGRCPLHRCPSR